MAVSKLQFLCQPITSPRSVIMAQDLEFPHPELLCHHVCLTSQHFTFTVSHSIPQLANLFILPLPSNCWSSVYEFPDSIKVSYHPISSVLCTESPPPPTWSISRSGWGERTGRGLYTGGDGVLCDHTHCYGCHRGPFWWVQCQYIGGCGGSVLCCVWVKLTIDGFFC